MEINAHKRTISMFMIYGTQLRPGKVPPNTVTMIVGNICLTHDGHRTNINTITRTFGVCIQ